MKTIKFTITIIFLLFIIQSKKSIAQASLAAEDIIDDVTINDGTLKLSFTVVRDARERKQWYYIQNSPSLTEVSSSSSTVPELSLLRYQKKLPGSESIIEGGLLQFAATLQLKPQYIQSLKSALENKFNDVDIRLSALPIKDATVAIYTPKGPESSDPSKLISYNSWGGGIAPIFSSQKMAFAVELTNLGSDIMEAIINGNTGIPIGIVYTYNGLTPKAGFKVTVDWDQTYNHYSNDSEFAASASYFGYFGASYKKSQQEIRSSLEQDKSIEVEIFSGENLTLADIDKYLQPILSAINNEVIAGFTPPAVISPAEAKSPEANGKYFSAGYSVALKNVSERRHGKSEINFKFQQIVERKTVVKGFIGLGAYPKEIRDRAVTLVKDGPLKTAFIPLPSVFDNQTAQNMGINEIVVTCNVSGNGANEGSLAKWVPGQIGWHIDGATTQSEKFSIPLAKYLGPGGDLKDVSINTEINIITDNGDLKTTSNLNSNQGFYYLNGVSKSSFDVISIDPTYIDYFRLSPSSPILELQMQLNTQNGLISNTFKPISVNGVYSQPIRQQILLPKNSLDKVTINMSMKLIDGTIKQYKNNGSLITNLVKGKELTPVADDFK